MRISAKGRYALAAMINMASHKDPDEYITVISISEKLDISKIYLEQVFSLLKRSGLVTSIKGSLGGYRLSKNPKDITLLDILLSIETTIFEKPKETVPNTAPDIEMVMRHCAFAPLDQAFKDTLENITLQDLVNKLDYYRTDQGYMFYI